MTVEPVDRKEMEISIKINGSTVTALLDTGSAFSILRKSTFQRLRIGRWKNEKIQLKGLSMNDTHALGKV